MRASTLSSLLLVSVLAACGPKTSSDTATAGAPPVNAGDTLNGVQTLPPAQANTQPPPPPPPPPVNRTPRTPPVESRPSRTEPPARRDEAPARRDETLDIGTTIPTTMIDSVHSRYTRVGDPVRVRVNTDVRGRDGRAIIPAGAIVTLQVTQIGMADSRGEKGTLELTANAIEINGRSHPFNARATDYEYEMKARGIGTNEVAKTGAGAVAGAIIGRVIGGKSGTVVGAVGGGMVGAAVASSTADRDIIVHVGTNMTLTMGDRFGG